MALLVLLVRGPRLHPLLAERALAPCTPPSPWPWWPAWWWAPWPSSTRLCMVGGIRDAVLFRDWHLLWGFIAILVAALIGNLITRQHSTLSFAGQPVAHTDGLWNALGMAAGRLRLSVLLGGCPLRQLILAGSGNSDSAVTVLGMLVGAACVPQFQPGLFGRWPHGQRQDRCDRRPGGSGGHRLAEHPKTAENREKLIGRNLTWRKITVW